MKDARIISTLSRLLFLFNRREKVLILQLLALMIVGTVLETVSIGAIPAFIALISRPEVVRNHSVVAGFLQATGVDVDSEKFIQTASVALVLLFLVKNAYLTGLVYASARFITGRQVSLSRRLFDAYMHAPYTFHIQRNSAELLRNVKGEVNEVLLLILAPALALCMDVLLILFIFTLLIAIEPIISVVALVVLGGTSLLFLSSIRNRLRTVGQRRHYLRAKLVQYFKQGLGGLKEARILGRENYFVEAYVETAREYAEAVRYHRVITSLPSRVIETIAIGGLLLFSLVMVVRETEMTAFVPMLALFAVAAIRLMPSFKRVVGSVANIRYHRPALDSLYGELTLLEGQNRPHHHDILVSPLPFQSQIEIKDLQYTYPGAARAALTGISLSIPAGAAVAFVGSSGAGKTTLANLLLGLLQPDSGHISVDGRDIRQHLSEWQRNIGYIPQTPYLSDDSVRRNIAFGIPDDAIDEHRIETVVAAAQLEDFIAGLPEGLSTSVGEEGVRISGGQRQRIAIARALYHDPGVLIMDEATSALDNETERYVIQALERLRRNRTIVMIAHRLTTVRNCDTLYVLRKGRLVSSGSYEELLAHSSEFRTIAAA